ncbi:tRNA (guanosine(37)-N1)-methyltransferase TrmD [Paracoccus denitrificans]|jgi:tRNA (guanine37-N1)-methyltransferase|uniref:tRNA (guanine-N(1)-)-methyltransferase n=1 Tax=Paracoccus denitrificans (strain Pd 1222) TaxID=318586 RepID=A1B8V5_PARDP|nr:tRNA (guanosine(37)-N1)-methyltransferase TrmD [Paracoccus denitrificans]ABL71949.1 tRNA (Guanine37-N(1)-) methyltransferase [Paracoccus denitrificans PD1222]MBB4626148.1 tRNA (guanine37-N1)-methyltransferase [Paracoccus denitrificans]MCU7430596.1 tRNA (guanosine(37)-N1)-methyltransferase TrmD [Paracoccus denitrificans]QAR28530.1 tRNA (guanosine(37)-N1)-methyltransferase TrmD [Paracoccus denitrificans]UFS66304.1 tRNA (guanosine(37)-N1)-methyltransferase TrmD [Paracoccus denitrificans]
MSEAPKSHGRLSIRASTQPRDLMAEPQVKGAWTAQVVTLFPEAFPGVLGLSLTGKALAEGLWNLRSIDLRPFGIGKHRNVDDTPAGGGAGMVIRPDVMDAALREAGGDLPVIYLSPRGKPFTQGRARELARGPGMTLICGRFEGVDQRVLDAHGVEEISIGDYVLTGGELAAQVLIDATVRLIPRVLGNQDSLAEESFSPDHGGLLEHPQYTKPALWEGRAIPEVLLSGNHAAIASWRRDMAERLTKERRPDLWRAYGQAHMDPAKDRQLSGASDQSRDYREHQEEPKR